MTYLTYKPTEAEHKLYAPKWLVNLELTAFCGGLFGIVYGLMLLADCIYNML